MTLFRPNKIRLSDPRKPLPASEPLEPRRLLAAGDLVTAFGSDGILAIDFDSQPSQVMRAVAQLPDGDLILSGETADFGSGQAVADYLARVNADGTLDSGFAGDGTLLLSEDDGASGSITELIALPDGDILYARRLATAAGGDVVRLNPDGSVDAGFGTGGRISISGFVPDLALLPSNQIVVAGGSIVRVYDADGTPRDENFETDLLSQTGIGSFTFGDVATDEDGNIFVAGEVRDAELRASVFKLGNSLALDSAYGDSGEARRDFFTLDIFSVASLAIDSTGRAIVGITEDDSENVLARFTADGQIDVDVPFRFSAGVGENELLQVAAQPDGKMLLGGYFQEGDANDIGLARFSGAARDESFGGDPVAGEQRYPLNRQEAFLTDMTFTNDDDLVLVGHRIAQPDFDADAVAFKVDLGDIDGDGGGGGGGNGIGDVTGFSELDGATLRLTGTSAADSFTWTTEQVEGREALVFIRAEVGSGASSVTAKYFRDDVESLVVSGLDGNDVIELVGLALPATLVGGAGNDRLTYDGAAARLEGGAGNDLLQGGDASDVLLGGDDNDSLTGGAGQDTLEGGGGADTLEAGAGSDSISGGGGADSVSSGDGDDIVWMSDADGDFTVDSVSGGGGRDTLDFTDRTGALAVQFGGEGGISATSFEVIVTGDSDDDLTLDDSAGAGMIEVRTGGGNDSVDAGARTEPVRFISGPGADTLIGGGGADVFLPGAGAEEGDVIFGGGGLDTLDFAAATTDLVLTRDSIGESGPTIQIADDIEIAWAGSGNDDLFGFLRSRGGSGNDMLTGALGEDSAMFGDEGDDGLFSLFINGEGVPAGRRGDYLEGGDGNDTLSGGIGADTFAGGNGNDGYDDAGGENVMTFADVISGSETGVVIDLSERSATLTAGDGTETLEDMLLVDVIGTRYADEIRGNELPNYLVGGDGNDTLFGGGQKDILLGGAGGDRLEGEDDFDLLLADSDTSDESPIALDTLIGGAGFDTGLADAGDEEDVELVFTSLESLMSQF